MKLRTAKREAADAPSMTWLRLASFVAIASVVLAAHAVLGADSLRELGTTALTALVAWAVGAVLEPSPVASIAERGLQSMPPERAEGIIERTILNLPPMNAQSIIERASLRPAARAQPQPESDDHGQEKKET